MSEDLSARVALALCEANEVLHQRGPAGYIEIKMRLAADYVTEECDYLIKPEIKEAEAEAKRYKYRTDVRRALIKGYKQLIMAYKESKAEDDVADLCTTWYKKGIRKYR